MILVCLFFFFFFKQKTAYEMRISDWSSDVCSSDLFDRLGSAHWLDGEEQFDLVTALAGSGPGFVYRFIDALSAAAQELGLAAEMADQLALITVDGAASLAASGDMSPGELADRVASPGGMTREGLNVLDQDNALKNLLKETLRATRDRGADLARIAREQG